MNEQPPPPRRRWGRGLLWLLGGLLLVYIASPYISFWSFTRVLRSSEPQRMISYVDFRSVRQSLKEQLRGLLAKSKPKSDPFAALAQRLAPSLIDQLVEAFVTPEGLAALIANPELAKQASAKNPAALTSAATAERRLDWSDVKYAFFTSPREFLVEVQGTKLRFRFSKFRWTLKTVELPLDQLGL